MSEDLRLAGAELVNKAKNVLERGDTVKMIVNGFARAISVQSVVLTGARLAEVRTVDEFVYLVPLAGIQCVEVGEVDHDAHGPRPIA